jgi:hypothetical protein
VAVDVATSNAKPMLCLSCGNPLRDREGKYALKYFKTGRMAPADGPPAEAGLMLNVPTEHQPRCSRRFVGRACRGWTAALSSPFVGFGQVRAVLFQIGFVLLRKWFRQTESLAPIVCLRSGGLFASKWRPPFDREAGSVQNLKFPDSVENALFLVTCTGLSKLMSQTAYALLIFIGLTLTGYFGLAAWQSSSEDRVTMGSISHSR